jgi:hypothetical protein
MSSKTVAPLPVPHNALIPTASFLGYREFVFTIFLKTMGWGIGELYGQTLACGKYDETADHSNSAVRGCIHESGIQSCNGEGRVLSLHRTINFVGSQAGGRRVQG